MPANLQHFHHLPSIMVVHFAWIFNPSAKISPAHIIRVLIDRLLLRSLPFLRPDSRTMWDGKQSISDTRYVVVCPGIEAKEVKRGQWNHLSMNCPLR